MKMSRGHELPNKSLKPFYFKQAEGMMMLTKEEIEEQKRIDMSDISLRFDKQPNQKTQLEEDECYAE